MGTTRGTGRATGCTTDRASGLIELRGVSKRFGAVVALDGVDLAFAPGEVHALLGENGAGKTTLLSLLSGGHRPDAGMILIDGHPVTISSPAAALGSGIGTVHQHLTLVPTLTVRENLLLGDEGGFRLGGRGEQGARSEERGRKGKGEGAEFGRLGLDLPMDVRVGGLAIGVRQRVEIAKALRRGGRALLLDEPTAVLAPAEVDALLAMVRGLSDAGRAVVLVTHKLDEALAVSDRITVLRAGRVVLSEVVGEDREALRGRVVAAMFSIGERGAGSEERGDGGRTGASATPVRVPKRVLGEDGRDASRGHGVARDLDGVGGHGVRSDSAGVGGLGDGGGHGVADAGGEAGAMNRAPTPVGDGTDRRRMASRLILDVDQLSARDERGSMALDGLSLELFAGEIVGVAGVEGNGQRELAEALAGQRRAAGGAIRLDGEDVTALGVAGRLEAGIAFLTDERLGEGIVPRMSVALNLALKRLDRPPFAAGVRLDRRAVRHRAAGLIADADVRPADPDRDIATLSGGNIQKALVARELAGNPRVLIASKPTAGLDLRTAERVLDRLRGHAEAGGAVLLISNELDELLMMSDRIAVLYRGRVADVVQQAAFDRASIGQVMLTGRAAARRKDGEAAEAEPARRRAR